MKRLSLDIAVPEPILARRCGISFASSTNHRVSCRPRLERRGAISFDKNDRNALYVRKLGDVRWRPQPDSNYQQIKCNLSSTDRKLIHSLALPNYKPRCGLKFHTVSGLKRRRRSSIKVNGEGQGLLDDCYNYQTKCILSKVSDWSFDVFALDKATNGRPLLAITLKLFQEHDLIEHFNLDMIKLMKFASLVEEGYHQNPYHNAIHAADVTQAMHCYIQQSAIAKHLTPIEKLICLLSAITHDLDHPGVNQAFLIATCNHLASLYKNNAVLENHHWRSAIGVLRESGLLHHLPKSTCHLIESQLKTLILATDMTRQQEFYSRLMKHVKENDLCMANFEDRHFILQIALKCADISNPCRHWSACKSWSERVCDEFFQQGDCERKLSLPITYLCDRFKNTVPKIQTGFIDHVVEPLFREFERFLHSDLLKEQLNNMAMNKKDWQAAVDQQLSTVSPIITLDINSNVRSKVCDRDIVCTSDPVSLQTESDAQSELSDLPGDILSIQNDIANLEHRLEFPSNNRRNSLPMTPAISADSSSLRRESFPCIHGTRRINLPITDVYQAVSFDRLADKLSHIERELAARNGNSLALTMDNLTSRPRISNLSLSMEASRLSIY